MYLQLYQAIIVWIAYKLQLKYSMKSLKYLSQIFLFFLNYGLISFYLERLPPQAENSLKY